MKTSQEISGLEVILRSNSVQRRAQRLKEAEINRTLLAIKQRWEENGKGERGLTEWKMISGFWWG